MKAAKKIASVILIIVLVCICILWYLSPGKTPDIPGGIATIEKPVINGLPQGMIIRGKNSNNPVLLYVHGGPGLPSYSKIKDDLKGLENIFTVCYWEQRGAGMSYSADIPLSTMTLEQFVEDAASVTRYLSKKFNQPKIYILGHSWGSLVSSWVVHKYPELYQAYIGIGQITDSYASEEASFRFAKEEALKRNDRKGIKDLAEINFPSRNADGKSWYDYFLQQRPYIFKYGGAKYGKSISVSDIAKQTLLCREYTITDKYHLYKGATFSLVNLSRYTMAANLFATLREQYIPIYIFQGIHDHQTDYTFAKKYFDSLSAPVKKFYSFPNSAHSPHQEAYAAFEKIVIDEILQP